MTEYTGVLLRISEVRPKSEIYITPLSETTGIPTPFICETPLPLPLPPACTPNTDIQRGDASSAKAY